MGADEQFSTATAMKEEMDKINAENQQTAESSTADNDNKALPEQEAELKELDNDEDFKKEVAELEKEIGKPSFGQSKRFRDLYRRMKESERTKSELQTKFEEESSREPEFDENKFTELAKQYGYKLTKEEKQQVEKLEELEELLSKAETPEQRSWLTNYAKAIESRILKQISPFVKDASEVIIEIRLEKSEKMARNHINEINKKYGLTLDYDKDIDPELVKMIRANPNISRDSTDLYKLTREYLADKGIELGKRLSERQQRELNEKKKQNNVESDGVISKDAEIDDSGKSPAKIMQEEMSKSGF